MNTPRVENSTVPSDLTSAVRELTALLRSVHTRVVWPVQDFALRDRIQQALNRWER